MPTSKEKDDIIKKLKDEIRSLKGKVSEGSDNDLTESTYGITLDEEGFKFLHFKYNSATGQAKLSDKELISKDLSIAVYKMKEKFVKLMYKLTENK